MMDQAGKLRVLAKKVKRKKEKKNDSRIISITSGKGGVGKTNFTVNLAIILSKMGNKVTIIDADLGLANIDVVLGVIPKYNLGNIINKEMSIKDIIMKGPEGINIVSGGSGVMNLVNLSEYDLRRLISNFDYLNEISDYILIDTGAGLNKSVLSFIEASNEVIVVVTPDPTSITDAYAVIKNVSKQNKLINLVINRIDTNKQGYEVYNKLKNAGDKFLNVSLENLGFIYEDKNVIKAVREQKPLIEKYPNTLASKGIETIAYNITNDDTVVDDFNAFDKFINSLFSKFN